jgi:hypothetical protein
MHSQAYYKVVIQNQRQGLWWDTPGVALHTNNVNTHAT